MSSTRPSTIPSAEQHAALMNELDETRLSLIKAINDAEGALAGKEAELARIQEELKNLKESDPSAEHSLDATACVVSPVYFSLYLLMEALQPTPGYVQGARLRTYPSKGWPHREDARSCVAVPPVPTRVLLMARPR